MFCISATAQSKQPSSIYKTHQPLQFHYYYRPSSSQSLVMVEHDNNNNPLHSITSGSIKDLPFFCALECKVRKHTNIWIKLRTGDDASYMKMIGATK
jgi:hypothetical protein